jgi:hypothetical protein
VKDAAPRPGHESSFPRDEIKIFAAGRRATGKRLLLVLGRGPDVVADDVEQLSHLDAPCECADFIHGLVCIGW